MRDDSSWAWVRSSSRICCPSARAWSRICAASVRASANWARYCSSAALASACIASARSMPPSIASRRARKTCSKRGATNLKNTSRTIAKAISPMMISPTGGRSGFSLSAARMLMLSVSLSGVGTRTRRYGSGAEDEGDDEADQRQRLGEGEPEEGVGPGQAGRLGLARGGLDVGRPHDAHTDARADRGEAVAHRRSEEHTSELQSRQYLVC